MRILSGIFHFYRKLVIPSLTLSLLLGLSVSTASGSFSLRGVGSAYIFFPLVFHYFIYEVRNKEEYYFYHNLGLSKIVLWSATFVISLLIGLILIVL